MTYNTTGRRIRTENLADPATVTLSYDAMGRQTRAVDAAGVTTLAYPNGLTASWAYGSRGELLEVDNALPSGSVSKYAYTYDAAGRRITCARSGTAFTTPDTYAYLYNARSELTNATAMVDTAYSYGYQFDDIGNRETASERGTNSVYEANNLNQYTSVNDFVPQFDADGNQTRVKTATGTWQVAYNGENRPVRWERIGQSEQSTNLSSVALAKEDRTILSMSYDRMGRRATKNDKCFVYNGYLQVADNNGNAYVWDPTEPVATRPLVWRHGGEMLFYAHDGNKNVSEVVASDGTLAAHYEYAPFGVLTSQMGALASVNPFRFSSEYVEEDTTTVYYNYRHYEPVTGRWLGRDPIEEQGGVALYGFCANGWPCGLEALGLSWLDFHLGEAPAEVGEWESLIPIYGSLRQFDVATYNGRWGVGMWHALMTFADVSMVRAGCRLVSKGVSACWKVGAHSWRATRAWYGKKFGLEKGVEVHHVYIPQRFIRRHEWIAPIANQPWNLSAVSPMRGLSSKQVHLAIHGSKVSISGSEARFSFSLWEQYWYSSRHGAEATMLYFSDKLVVDILILKANKDDSENTGPLENKFSESLDALKNDVESAQVEW